MKWFFLLILSLIGSLGISQHTIHVSPQGNNANNGSKESPVLDLDTALSQLIPGKENTIILHEGNYYIHQGIQISQSNLSIVGKGKVIFNGGKSLDIKNIKKIIGSEYEYIFPKENLQYIYYYSLDEIDKKLLGKIKSIGFGKPYSIAPTELFINHTPGQIARWPNDSTVLITDLIDPGNFPISPDDNPRGGTIEIANSSNQKWNYNTDDIWIEGYFNNGYAMDALPVKNWNTTNNVIKTQIPHRYGFVSGHPWNRLYAYNIPEEIDQNNEYYIDHKKGIIFFYSKKEIQQLEISIIQEPVLTFQNSSNILLDNILFKNTRNMGILIPECNNITIQNCIFKNIGSLGIWTGKYYLKENEFISERIITGTNQQYFTREKNNYSYVENITIQNCEFLNMGAGGVRLAGGNRYELQASNHKISNCTFKDFNRIEKSYRPAILLEGVGHHITNCEISGGDNQAILLKGNNHIIEYNDIHDVCLNVDDAGAIYYGRNPSERGHIIRHNYIHHIGINNEFQTSAIYHDDGACGMEVYGNAFLKAGNIVIFIGGGSDNHYHNNLFLDGFSGIHIDDRFNQWGAKFIAPGGVFHQRLADINHDSPPYSTAYPHLARYWNDLPQQPKRNIFEQNIFCSIGMLFTTGNLLLDWKDDNVLSSGYPSIWDDKINQRSFRPNDAYLPRPQSWHPIEWDKIGTLSQ